MRINLQQLKYFWIYLAHCFFIDKVKFSVNYDGADLEATDFVAEITIGNLDGGQVADGVSVAFVQLSIDDLLGALETDDVSATAFSEFVGDAGSDGRYEIETSVIIGGEEYSQTAGESGSIDLLEFIIDTEAPAAAEKEFYQPTTAWPIMIL